MTSPPRERRCAETLNSFHSIIYFAPDLDERLSGHGVTDTMAAYLAGRAAPLGAVGPGVVVAAFNAFSVPLVARHLPDVWQAVSPELVLDTRLAAVDALLRRLLGPDVLGSPELAEAAALAWSAVRDCPRAGRPMFSANVDLAAPEQPHLLLWHATTLAREYRGDGHVTVLGYVELSGLEALVTHCASPVGMPRQIVQGKRGWTDEDWAGAENRLRERGLLDASGALTGRGLRLREEIEAETDRLDRLPYALLGETGVARLTELVGGLVDVAATADAFPGVLREFFVPGVRGTSL